MEVQACITFGCTSYALCFLFPIFLANRAITSACPLILFAPSLTQNVKKCESSSNREKKSNQMTSISSEEGKRCAEK
ncbi:hypothetical protein F4778DRAFT_748603 [Xylariomycetidae sp. FL2044]|nr:hypothetical protein F4778DRAFT_748603 [Xylariomycetidae sp. FL2044]